MTALVFVDTNLLVYARDASVIGSVLKLQDQVLDELNIKAVTQLADPGQFAGYRGAGVDPQLLGNFHQPQRVGWSAADPGGAEFLHQPDAGLAGRGAPDAGSRSALRAPGARAGARIQALLWLEAGPGPELGRFAGKEDQSLKATPLKSPMSLSASSFAQRVSARSASTPQ